MSSTASHKIQPTPRPPLRRGPTYQPPPSAPRPEPPLVTPSICATPTQPPRHRGPRRQRSLSTSLVTHHRRSSSLSRLMRSPASSSLASPPLESPSPSTVDAGTYFSNLTLETPRGPILPEVKLVQAAPLANASLQMLVLGGQPLRDVGLDEEIEYERMTALRKLKSSNDLSCSPVRRPASASGPGRSRARQGARQHLFATTILGGLSRRPPTLQATPGQLAQASAAALRQPSTTGSRRVQVSAGPVPVVRRRRARWSRRPVSRGTAVADDVPKRRPVLRRSRRRWSKAGGHAHEKVRADAVPEQGGGERRRLGHGRLRGRTGRLDRPRAGAGDRGQRRPGGLGRALERRDGQGEAAQEADEPEELGPGVSPSAGFDGRSVSVSMIPLSSLNLTAACEQRIRPGTQSRCRLEGLVRIGRVVLVVGGKLCDVWPPSSARCIGELKRSGSRTPSLLRMSRWKIGL